LSSRRLGYERCHREDERHRAKHNLTSRGKENDSAGTLPVRKLVHGRNFWRDFVRHITPWV
jgi:hypothetical protein